MTPELLRLAEDARRDKNWKRWGSYLSARQWGTVREDYSATGDAWDYFPHDHARSRAYRWGEDGLLGITDRECRLCFALTLWNGQDAILKERLFGLSGPEGNHGEDVKECYFYLDATPTHSWMRALYKYPQRAFPYEDLLAENRRRGRGEGEYELIDTGIFDESRYFDVNATYAKGGPNDLCLEISIANRGPEAATLHFLPTIWFRNSWSWSVNDGKTEPRPLLRKLSESKVECVHPTLGKYFFESDPANPPCGWLFTENDTNTERLFGQPNRSPYLKDSFEAYVLRGNEAAVNPQGEGTKAAPYFQVSIPAQEEKKFRFRLYAENEKPPEVFGNDFSGIFAARLAEADQYYHAIFAGAAHLETQPPFGDASGKFPPHRQLSAAEKLVARQAYAGLLWSKQYYSYIIREWLRGDPGQPAPPPERKLGRNWDWSHVYARDVLSMPDNWEYPWFAAWDLAFHMLPLSRLDPAFAKEQLNLLLREWYMHPNGQLPAYEWAFSDANPPVHAWACWRVYKMTGPRGGRDRVWLGRVFQKLLINFTWWVNRKDPNDRNLFSGGFLGLDNVGVFDRSKPLPTGGSMEQADGTAWMAFYCGTMLSMALELAEKDPAYEDIASKFFEHFIAIADAMNHLGGSGLWHEEDGFYYDQLLVNGKSIPVRLRSTVGIIPLYAVELIDAAQLKRLPGFAKRTKWFFENRQDLASQISYMESGGGSGKYLLAIPTRERLERVLRYAFDENELLSPHGLRSLSKKYDAEPYVLTAEGGQWSVKYEPAESHTGLFGGNSNWRGPIWFPTNYLLIEALERYHYFYGDSFTMEFPTGSGQRMNLLQISQALSQRLVKLFLPDGSGARPLFGGDNRFAQDPHWKDLLWFHEYFHGDTGKGLGADHQTGWTALVARLLKA